MTERNAPLALALFSGGLDSILAAKIIQEQGLRVIGLHFVSPFFGKPENIPRWERLYGLEIRPVDVSEDYVRLLAERPRFGFGSVLNPCVDCKILMLRHARRLMDESEACCVISGEVLGQRPMSQRRDALNAISRDSGLRGKLLRPLCAQHMEPTQAELDGLIDRSRLPAIAGRGRKQQMELAERFQLKEIPTPAGGCRLTEKENARSYWPVLRYSPAPSVTDFRLANTGRQYWHIGEEGVYRLIIGRMQADNDAIMALAEERDILLKTRDFPGPVALARHGAHWPEAALSSAAAFTASYSGKAMRHVAEQGGEIAMRAHPGSLDNPGAVLLVAPSRAPELAWREYTWEESKLEIKQGL
jgi:hypothetical protein